MTAAMLSAVTAHAQVVPPAATATVTPLANGAEAHLGETLITVVALTDDILRVRVGRAGHLDEDASWAVSPAVRAQRVAVTATSDGFSTSALIVHLAADGRLTVTNRAGKIITADAEPLKLDGRSFTLKKAMPLAEHYFGMGDKTGTLDRRGYSYVDWNTDAFGFLSSSDPIYKSIPFFLGVGGDGGSYGIFLDNTWRTWFDFGHREENTLAIGGPDGPIDYYIIAGPTTAEVVRRYTDLTGKAPLAPQWSLGYQQSRYSYMTADEVRQVANRLRADKIPTDVLWLDIDYQDRNRPFTVNTQSFPNLPGLISDLGGKGFKVFTITDLHVAHLPGQNYAPYDSGAAIDAFVHRRDGQTYVAPVWPGPSVFPDFTSAKVRDWWGGLFKGEVNMGVAGAWNDMNEPAVFDTPTKTMPLDTVHYIASDDFATRNASHAELHNVYGMENARATYDGLRRLRPDERAQVMTRASYAGGQRYSVTWTGDNSATWDHLRLSVQQIINLGLSGFSYSAADVSGFAGGPSADLLTRWFEIGAFYPIFRDHSAKGTPRVEPWVDGPVHEAIRRHFIEERYKLLPYLYGLAELNSRTGDPILRPVFYNYPQALTMSCDQSMTFTLGKSLLVAPPPRPESPQSYDVCLPAGGWFDYWTGKRAGTPQAATEGPIQSATQATGGARALGDTVSETPRLDTLPVFVRAGTILPRQAVVQSTADTPQGPLQLDIYPGPDCMGSLYFDDGHSMGFTRGQFFRQQIRCVTTPTGLKVTWNAPQGRYKPWWHDITVTVHGWTGPGTVTRSGRSLASHTDAAAETIAFELATAPGATTLEILK
jgi:alpha-glucosidase